MGASTTNVVLISLFLIFGMLLAGFLIQPKGSLQIWEIKESDFPANGTSEDRLIFLLNYAILAPSKYNSQPWRFNVSGDEIRLYADESRWLSVVDADKREFYMNLGSSLENLIIAAEHFGYICQTTYFPGEENLVASIKLVPGASPISSGWLFDAIHSRQDNVELFSDQVVSDGDLEKLRNLFLGKDIQMQIYSNSEIKNGFRDLVVKADQIHFADVNYRSELGHWWGQGTMGKIGVQALAAQAFIVLMDAGPEKIRKDSELVNSSHILGLISTKENGRKSWVMTGQAFERLWLAATTYGICIYPMSQPLEISETKAELTASLLSPDFGNIQQTFLLGYAKDKSEPMPRRPLSETLIESQK